MLKAPPRDGEAQAVPPGRRGAGEGLDRRLRRARAEAHQGHPQDRGETADELDGEGGPGERLGSEDRAPQARPGGEGADHPR